MLTYFLNVLRAILAICGASASKMLDKPEIDIILTDRLLNISTFSKKNKKFKSDQQALPIFLA